MGLKKMLENQSDLRKELMRKIISGCKAPDDIRCEVKTELLLVCPDHLRRGGHRWIPVNSTNQETCLAMWCESELLEFGSLLRCPQVDAPIAEVTLLALCDDLLHEIWDWKPLGLKLGIPISYLKGIEHDYHRLQDRKQETLSRWLQLDECPSWLTLVEALVRIHQRYLARTIAEKYGIPIQEVDTAYKGTLVATSDDNTRLNPGLMADIQSQIDDHDSKLAEIDKKLDEVKRVRTQERERSASTRESAALVVRDVEHLEREKEALKDEIKKKEKELKYFKKLHEKPISDTFSSQSEKEDLLELIKTKEWELMEANERLKKKEKKLMKCKEKIQSLKKRIEEGIREAGVYEGKIIMLEQDKARIKADLESERKKVEQLRIEAAAPPTPQPQCVPEEVTAEIVSLKNLVAEKTADIETHSKKIVLLEEQLQAQVELTARSLSQYEELAKLQVAKAEKEKEKMIVQSELTATTRGLPDSQIMEHLSHHKNLSPDGYHGPSNHAANKPFALYEIRLMRQVSGFGFRIIGGSDKGAQPSVADIVPGGAADLDGRLQVGDEITHVNGHSVIDAPHHNVISAMGEALAQGEVVLNICRNMPVPEPQFQQLQPYSMNHSHREYQDYSHGPFPEGRRQQGGYDEKMGLLSTTEINSDEDEEIHRIHIRRDGHGFGFSIRGGAEYSTPLCVVSMAMEGAAERNRRLMVGDVLLEINGNSTEGMLHSDAITIIKHGGDVVKLIVRRVAKKCYV